MDIDTLLREADPARSQEVFLPADLGLRIMSGAVPDRHAAPWRTPRLRTARRAGVVVLVCASVAASVVVVSLIRPTRSGTDPARPAGGSAVPAKTAHGDMRSKPDIIGLAQLFPATSAEFNSFTGQAAMLTFLKEVQDLKANACLESKGFTAPNDLIPIARHVAIPYDNTQFPDVSLYATGHFLPGDGVAKPPPGQGPSHAASLEWPVCADQAQQTVLSPVSPLLRQLDNAWGEASGEAYISPPPAPVRAAWASWDSCVRNGGVAVANDTQFFGLADEATGLPGYHHSVARVRFLATLYGKCIPPVVAALDQVRLADRKQFVLENSASVKALEARLSTLIAGYSKEYRIPYPPRP